MVPYPLMPPMDTVPVATFQSMVLGSSLTMAKPEFALPGMPSVTPVLLIT